MSTFADTLASIDAHNHMLVQQETWGHLAPKRNKKYKGRIVYAVGCFGSARLNPTPITCDFDGLDSSPWFYEALCELIGGGEAPRTADNPHGCSRGCSYMLGGLINEEGCVYEWTGTLRNYKFTGQRRKLLDANV